MRVNRVRGRGRPRGKYRSHADVRCLQYLAHISTKYGIDSDTFFNHVVEAWKQQETTCHSLSIECRRKTLTNAIFLITNDHQVVAQFPIPNHILEQTSPLKMFHHAQVPGKTLPQEVKDPRISDLKSGMKRINLNATILEIPRAKQVVTRLGKFATVSNANITDETGEIHLPLWNNQIDTLAVGDVIHVENAHVVTFRGERQLRVGRGGHLSVIEKK